MHNGEPPPLPINWVSKLGDKKVWECCSEKCLEECLRIETESIAVADKVHAMLLGHALNRCVIPSPAQVQEIERMIRDPNRCLAVRSWESFYEKHKAAEEERAVDDLLEDEDVKPMRFQPRACEEAMCDGTVLATCSACGRSPE